MRASRSLRLTLAGLAASSLAATALAIPAQAGTAPAAADGVLPVPPAVATTGPAAASYLHDVSEPISGVDTSTAVVEQHRVKAPDGVQIDTWIVRPKLAEKVPVVLRFTPYYGGGNPKASLGEQLEHLFERGYAVGVASMRGTGASGGCFTIGGPAEAKDSAAVINYYGTRAWSNGNVGLMGVSYDGTAPQDVWVEAPEHLKTIVPIAGISDLYKYNYVNGVASSNVGFNTYYWLTTGLFPIGLGGGNLLSSPVDVPGAVIGEACAERIPVTRETFDSFLDGNKDAYWQQRDFLAELKATSGKQRASVFYIHGLQDWNVKPHNMEGWLPAVQATGVPFKSWQGQWDHNWPQRADWLLTMTAWFDQFLKNRDTGVLDAPPVQVQDDAGTWRHEQQSLGVPDANVVVHPLASGALGTSPGTGSASFFDYSGAPLTGMPGDRVAFTSAPVSNDLHLAGMPRFEGSVTATGLGRANLFFSLGEQTPDGKITYLNYGVQSLNHVANPAAGKLSIFGLKQKVGLNFFPQDDVIEKGNRIVLVAAGNLAQGAELTMAPVASGSQINLDLSDARLILPHDTTLTTEPITP